VAIDRAQTLKNAEKLLRQGKLDAAIGEYVRIVEEQPRDWNSRNTLGDLYVRAGHKDRAVAQYTQIAEHLTHDGFYSKAAALFKKILKITPDEESVHLNLGELSARQGLLADAKGSFTIVANKRRARGDRAGADNITIRLGSLDPSDFDARVKAARILAQREDYVAAARQYRSMHADLLEKGRTKEALDALREAVKYNPDDAEGRAELAKLAIESGDLETAKQYLDRSIAGDNPALQMALLDMQLRSGAPDDARELLRDLLSKADGARTRIVDMAWTLAPSSADGAFVCIDVAVEAELAVGNYMDAAAILQEFVTRVPGQIGALLRLIDISVDGGLEAIMYETQAHLADAYLEAGQGSEARVIAEDLVAREPWEHAHIDRFRRALVMLNVPDPDSVIADRLAGQGPFVATDPFTAPESFGEPEPPLLQRGDRAGGQPPTPSPEPQAPEIKEPPAPEPPVTDPPAPPAPPRAAEPDIPLRPRAVSPRRSGDIDLTNVLAGLQDGGAPAAPAQPLESAFDGFRSAASQPIDMKEASDHLALARTYIEMGMQDEAMSSLRIAARAPGFRFEAASNLGRMYLEKSDIPRAIEWLERAAEVPAPNPDRGRELLYDLGSILETSGEVARALAVFLELQADAGDYRDVSARVDRLARVQTGG
jgi:tetratricopeptide (TPR) repeat protein